MSGVAAQYVVGLFRAFDAKGVRYAVLRDLNNVLPLDYDGEKDVDVVVHPGDWVEARQVLSAERWFEVLHPFDNLKDFTFLYGMEKFRFFIRGNAKLDVCFQLACRSTNAGEWIPLDQEIQESVWRNRCWDGSKGTYILSPIDECTHLLARAFFDKKEIDFAYRQRIASLWRILDEAEMERRLRLVFFRAAKEVVFCVRSSDYDGLIARLAAFHDY